MEGATNCNYPLAAPSRQSENFRLSYRLKLERTDDSIQITSTGVAPLGARRTLRMRLKDSFKFIRDNHIMEVPAVITLLGTNPTGTAGNSAAHSLTDFRLLRGWQSRSLALLALAMRSISGKTASAVINPIPLIRIYP